MEGPTLLAQEWLKLRYGVFEEQGWRGDDLYPGNLAGSATSCDTVFSTSAPSCNYSVTKQAVMCRGRSALEMILSHGDFENMEDVQENAYPAVKLEVVREPITTLVLAIETSSLMAEGQSWRWIQKAVHRLLRYQLPVNSALALITFSGRRVTLEQGVVAVTSQAVRARLADTIPGRYHLTNDTTSGCISCVMEEVIKKVVEGRESGTHLVLLTLGGRRSEEDRRKAEELAARHLVKVSSILLPPHLGGQVFDRLASETGGRSQQMTSTGHGLDLLLQLNTALDLVLREASLVVTEEEERLHLAEYYSGQEGESRGQFTIDPTLGRHTQLLLYVEDEEDHLVEAVTFTDSTGRSYGPFTKMSSQFDPANIKTIAYLGKEPPFGDPQQLGKPWSYSIQWSDTRLRSLARKSLVVVTSRPRSRKEADLVTVELATSDQTSLPLSVVARVAVGGRPVINATVMLEVEVRNENGTTFPLPLLALLDDGRGVPDLVAGDGQYTARLPSYPSTGRYTMTVTVTADSSTRTFRPLPNPQTRSTGSSILPGPEALQPTGAFTRSVVGPVVTLDTVPVTNILAPARVVDLFLQPGTLEVMWTAPGGDYLAGSTTGFQVFVAEDPVSLLAGAGIILLRRERIQVAGATNREEFHLLPSNTSTLYLGVRHQDAAGNLGPVSNLVVVEREAAGAGTPASSSLATLQRVERDWLVVGVLCGAVGVLAAITTAALVYLCHLTRRQRRRRTLGGRGTKVAEGRHTGKKSGSVVSSDSSEQTDDTSFELELPPHPVHLDRELPPKAVPPSPGSPSSRGTPVYWSASQILAKVTLTESPSGTFPPLQLDPGEGRRIPDEFYVTVSDLHYRDLGPNHNTQVSQMTHTSVTLSFRCDLCPEEVLLLLFYMSYVTTVRKYDLLKLQNVFIETSDWNLYT